MTRTEANNKVRDLGFVLSKMHGEFRLSDRIVDLQAKNPKLTIHEITELAEDRAYYTDDLQDAVDTARAWRVREEQK